MQVEETVEIDLKEYLDMIWVRKWIIIGTTLLAIIVSALVSFFVLDPVYQSSTTIIVGRSNESEQAIEYNDIMLNQKLVDTYSVVVKSKAVLSKVITNLKLVETPDQLKEKVSVSPVSDTEIIEIKVEDVDPKLATDIANDVAKVFMDNITELMKIDNVQIIDEAEVPTNPIKPNKKLNVLIAAVLGAMIGLGIVFLMEYLDNTFKSPTDVEKHLGLSIIGVIPLIEEEDKEEQGRGE